MSESDAAWDDDGENEVELLLDRRVMRGATRYALPGTLAGARGSGQRVAAAAGACTLPGEVGGVLRRGPAPPRRPPGRARRRPSVRAADTCGARRVSALGSAGANEFKLLSSSCHWPPRWHH